MKRFIAPLVIVVAIGVALHAAYNWAYPSGALRYRLTVEVMVDGKTYSGSTVLEAGYAIQPKWLSVQNRATTRVRGQAAVVDLGAKGKLFVTLEGPPSSEVVNYDSYLSDLPIKKFLGAASAGSLSESQIRSLGRITGEADLSDQEIPMLVRFEDLKNPRSVRLVLPGRLSAAFGPGAGGLRARIETTNEALTGGVVEVLPWLRGFTGYEAFVRWSRERRSPVWVRSPCRREVPVT